MLSFIKLVLMLFLGGAGIIFFLLGVLMLKTPNHIWEENRRKQKMTTSEFWDRYREDRLYEECERIWSDKKRNRRRDV